MYGPREVGLNDIKSCPKGHRAGHTSFHETPLSIIASMPQGPEQKLEACHARAQVIKTAGIPIWNHGGSAMLIYASHAAVRQGKKARDLDVAHALSSQFYSFDMMPIHTADAPLSIKQFVIVVLVSKLLSRGGAGNVVICVSGSPSPSLLFMQHWNSECF